MRKYAQVIFWEQSTLNMFILHKCDRLQTANKLTYVHIRNIYNVLKMCVSLSFVDISSVLSNITKNQRDS